MRINLFTAIVDPTKHATRLGDERWRELIGQHDSLVRAHLARFRGREIDTAGDGFFATFDGPIRAIRCACAISAGLQDRLSVRIGFHSGACEMAGEKIAGTAVHIGARVTAIAGPDEVLGSPTVKDLVAGSELTFVDPRGASAERDPGLLAPLRRRSITPAGRPERSEQTA